MAEEKKLETTLIVFSGELDKIMTAFLIATGAAASNMKVTMFFTFWGLRAIKKKNVRTGKSFMGKMMGIMERGDISKASPSKYSMGGLGRWMFNKMMGAKGVPSLVELRQMAIDLGVGLYACQMSMDVLEIPRESMIDEVKDVVGVAFMLEHSKDSYSTLYI